jgi:NADPH2:quinone reductase
VGEQPTPNAGLGEVRIKVRASGINPADVKLRAGLSNYGHKFPFVIPNSDGAGVVDQVGEGVQPSWLGKRVWIVNGQRLGRSHGTAAEYITILTKWVTELPDCASFAEGASLGIPAMTAYHGVFGDGPVSGKTVLVTGGAGAVGYYAVALAHWGGARVFATVSGPEKSDRAKAGGAEATINYREEDVPERIAALTNGHGVDRVVSVDFGGDMAWLAESIALNGAVSAYASDTERTPTFPFHLFARRNIVVRPFILNSLPADVLDRTRWGVDSWVRACPDVARPVAQVFSLDAIAQAHEAVESGAKFGTVVVEP